MNALGQKFVVGHQQRIAASYGRAAWLVLLGAGALLPRVLGLVDFMTADEVHHWIGRVERFSAAVTQGNWAQTIQTGHPGVTVMWLGSLGLLLERMVVAFGWTGAVSPVEHLAWLRAPLALVQALAIPLGYVLLRRLVDGRIAAIAALLWATSPILIAHSRVLHLDGLLTTFSTLSVLAILIACRSDQPWRWIVGAGVALGLALLTKGPALVVLPIVGVLLLWCVPATRLHMRVWLAFAWGSAWLGVGLIVVVLLWPALWVDPVAALMAYGGEIFWNGGRPNGDGQFFLGRALGDPGPLFYPVADLFRLTPVALLGLLLLPLALRRASDRSTLFALGAFVLFWTLVMTLGPKKFDRYVLPTWPALLVLAAAGLAAALGALWSVSHGERFPQRDLIWRRVVVVLASSVLVAATVQPLITYHPYYLSYYNPLLGGGAAAQRNLLIGWGEGMDQIGAYLSSRRDIGYGPILSALPAALQPFVPVPVKDVTEWNKAPANYAVVYLESIQRRAYPQIYAQLRQGVPLTRITIHGIEYAEIYQLPKPFAEPVGAQFGTALHLRGITVDQTPGQLTVTPSWDVRGPIAGDYMLFMHVFDASGQRVAQIDVPPGGGAAPATGAWQPGEQIAVPLPIALPADLPPGTYQIVAGLYDPTTGARLPLTQGTAADPALAGPDALVLPPVPFAP